MAECIVIHVVTMSGPLDTLSLPTGSSVDDIKVAVEQLHHIPRTMQRLVYENSDFTDHQLVDASRCGSVELLLVKLQLPLEGLLLHLDGQNEDSFEISNGLISVWRTSNHSLEEVKMSVEEDVPAPQKPGEDGLVHFSHNESLMMVPEIGNLQTVISIHSFEDKDGCEHPFYILTGTQQGPFHGITCEDGRKMIVSGHGKWVTPEAFHGRIRLNGGPWQLAKDAELWSGLRLATFECSAPLHGGNRVNRIGRDRIYHSFCGALGELMIYDRTLTELELESVEGHLLQKWKAHLCA